MIEIVYEDQHLLVANKPSNLLSVPGKQHKDNLWDILLASYPNLRLVHRLDMATSGLIVFALSHDVQVSLSQQFERREVRKQYAALVQGQVQAACGEISLPLMCDWPNRPRQKVAWLAGRTAQTHFKVLSRGTDRTLLHLHPVTGRSHQLRVHCQAIGHPIAGDRFYNPHCADPRLMLHAERLHFEHPFTRQPFECFLPAPFDLSAT